MLIVVLLIVVIRIMMPGKEDKQETETTPAVLTTAPTEPAPTAPPSPMPTTPPETEPVVEVYRTSGSVVNVRSEPSTSSRILARLPRGTEIDYVKRYNNDWAVINYDGQEVYISNQYIELVDPEAEETEGTTETTAQTTAP